MAKCPRCKKNTMNDKEVRNSKSRRDNKTYICNSCGTTEALIDGGFEEADKIETDFIAKVALA